MHSLPLFVVVRDRPVILVGDGEAAEAKRRLLERAGARIVDEKGDAPLAVVALEDRAAAERVVARLRQRGVLVNAVDRPELCDFTFPAIVDRDPVLVAVGTGGASAGLAKALRQRLERILPARLGALARKLEAMRVAIRRRWPDAADRRHAIDAALDEGGLLDPFASHDSDAADEWLESRSRVREAKLVPLVLRSLDPHDLTIGESLLLGHADRVYFEPGVPPAIVDRARADALRIETATEPAGEGRGLAVYITLPR